MDNKDVENFAHKVEDEGAYGWNNWGLYDLGSIGDGKLLQLYVDAKTKAEEFQKAHDKFIEYVEQSPDYDF